MNYSNYNINASQKVRFGIPVWLRWFIYTLTGIVVALVAMIAGVGSMINQWQSLFFGAMVGGVFGLFSATAQALVLKKYLPTWRWWIIATTSAWIVFWSLNMAGYFGRGAGLQQKIAEGILHGSLLGFLSGFPQSLCFYHRRQSVQWIIASMIIWSCSAATADCLRALFNWQGPAEFLVALPLTALLSGITIQRLLARKHFTQALNYQL